MDDNDDNNDNNDDNDNDAVDGDEAKEPKTMQLTTICRKPVDGEYLMNKLLSLHLDNL